MFGKPGNPRPASLRSLAPLVALVLGGCGEGPAQDGGAGPLDDRPVIRIAADAPLGAPSTARPTEPGALQRALAETRGPAILELEAGRHELLPTDFVDLSCGNCPDPEESVAATVGALVAGRNLTLRGSHPDSVVIRTNAGYGLLFEGCHGCELAGVSVTGGVRDPDDRATNAAIVARDARVRIADCRIRDNIGDSTTVAGVVVGIAGIAGREGSHLTVEGCRIERNSWDGIVLYRGARAEIRDNVVDGVDAASGATIGGGRGVGIGLTWNAEAVIEGNLVRRYWKGIGAFVDAEAVIRRNVVEEILTWGISHWAAGDGGARALIEDNAIFRTGACGVMLAGSEAAGPTPGAFVGNAVVETGGNPAYDDGEPYCVQVPVTVDGAPPGFIVAENLLHANRDPGATEPLVQLDPAAFRSAAAPLLDTLRAYRALEGSSFLAEWGGGG